MIKTFNDKEVVEKKYGIYNSMAKCFQFRDIQCNSPKKAELMLFNKIGNDARKYRFEIRKIRGEDCYVSKYEKERIKMNSPDYEYIFGFGKYKGKSMTFVLEKDKQYIKWCLDKCIGKIKQVIELPKYKRTFNDK